MSNCSRYCRLRRRGECGASTMTWMSVGIGVLSKMPGVLTSRPGMSCSHARTLKARATIVSRCWRNLSRDTSRESRAESPVWLVCTMTRGKTVPFGCRGRLFSIYQAIAFAIVFLTGGLKTSTESGSGVGHPPYYQYYINH